MAHLSTSAAAAALAVSFAGSLLGTSVQAQSLASQCAAQPTATKDACQKVIDVFDYVAPSIGTIITGGNATLGQIGSIGQTGRFTVELRAVGTRADLPQLNNLTVSTTGAQQSTFQTKQQFLGFPTADVAVGLFKGLPLGLAQVGSVDLLVNLAYIPKITAGNYSLTVPNGSFKAGFGARVGLLNETSMQPGVAFTILRRDLPTVGIGGSGFTTDQGDTLSIDQLELHTTSWRVTAGKHAGPLGVVFGAGKDHYNSSASLHAAVAQNGSTGSLSLTQSVDRTNLFADVSLLFLHFEVGHVSGGSIPTYNSFAGDPSPPKSLTYYATGIQFGL